MDIFKWILVAIAVGTILYNTIVTHAVLKNEVKHLAIDMAEVKKKLWDLVKILIPKK